MEYVTALASAPQTWALAAEYLAWCPVHGEAGLRALLARLPAAGDDRLALKALQVSGCFVSVTCISFQACGQPAMK